MEAFIAALVLAILLEGTLTYLFGESSEEPTRPVLRYISLGLGVLLAVIYQIDILALVGVEAVWSWIGYITSGLIIGRGSNYVNDFVTKIRE